MPELLSEDGKKKLRKYPYILIVGGALLLMLGISNWGISHRYLSSIIGGIAGITIGIRFLIFLKPKK